MTFKMTINEAIKIVDPETTWLEIGLYSSENSMKAYHKACKLVIDELRKRQWTSVEDRLPDAELQEAKDKHFYDLNFDDNPSIEVIVIISGANATTTLYYDGSCFCDQYGEQYSVTHWMPLPEPPEAGDNDKN